MLAREGESIRNRAAFVGKKTLDERVEETHERSSIAASIIWAVAVFDSVLSSPFLLLLTPTWYLWQLSRRKTRPTAAELRDPTSRRKWLIKRRFKVADPLLTRLNHIDNSSNTSVFWFLVPETPIIPLSGFLWQGRLVALSKLIAEKLSKSEEESSSYMKALERRFSNLDIALHQQEQRISDLDSLLRQHMQHTKDGARKIEQMLETLVCSTPLGSLSSSSGE